MQNEFKEVVGSMQSQEQFEAAVHELETSGIDRAQISVLAQEEVAASCAEALGCDINRLPRVEVPLWDDRQQVRTPVTSLAAAGASLLGAGTALAATGGAAAPAVLAALASGGSVGGIAALFGRHHEAESHEWAARQVLNGGILLIVSPATAQQLETANAVLRRHCGDDVF